MKGFGALKRLGLCMALACGPAQAAATQQEAARLLTQASYGPTSAEIDRTAGLGVEGWLNDQFQQSATLHRPQLDGPGGIYSTLGEVAQDQRQEIWWRAAVTAPDQLRQRVAFALSEIMVVSDNNSQLYDQPLILAEYYDVLVRNAFGNYRQLLEDVTLSPAMGLYLSMLRNNKADAASGRHPDENFAREVQQLFSIGLYKLNLDGSRQLDGAGQPLPTYSQDTIENFARAFTGWTWADAGGNWYAQGKSTDPMIAFEDHHDSGAKTLLNGAALPAGQTAAQDLKAALDNIFNHPNVAPFVSRRLIQRLVTSNPSPGYIQRVAQVFENNGTGMRGDLKSVVYAILTDPEARSEPGGNAGKPREPLLRLAGVWRAFNASAQSLRYNYPHAEYDFFQAPLRSPSVFNFFQPDFRAPGEVADAGLYSPEFQIENESQAMVMVNAMTRFIRAYYRGTSVQTDSNTVLIDLSTEKSLAADPAALLDHLNLLMLGGRMSSPMRDILLEHLQAMPAGDGTQRAVEAVFLIATSHEYAVQK